MIHDRRGICSFSPVLSSSRHFPGPITGAKYLLFTSFPHFTKMGNHRLRWILKSREVRRIDPAGEGIRLPDYRRSGQMLKAFGGDSPNLRGSNATHVVEVLLRPPLRPHELH